MHGTPYEVLRQHGMNLLEKPSAKYMVISAPSDPWFSKPWDLLNVNHAWQSPHRRFPFEFNPCSQHTRGHGGCLSTILVSLLWEYPYCIMTSRLAAVYTPVRKPLLSGLSPNMRLALFKSFHFMSTTTMLLLHSYSCAMVVAPSVMIFPAVHCTSFQSCHNGASVITELGMIVFRRLTYYRSTIEICSYHYYTTT